MSFGGFWAFFAQVVRGVTPGFDTVQLSSARSPAVTKSEEPEFQFVGIINLELV